MSRTYKTGEVADLAGITIRTLRYYDSIGLLKPGKVLGNGHRLYDSNDIKKLQVILGLKVLGFSLKDIQKYLETPDVNLVDVLKCQQQSIVDKIQAMKDIDKKITNILERFGNKETVAENDVFAIYSMLQMIDHNAVLLQYFSPEEVQETIENAAEDDHEALYEAVKLLSGHKSINLNNKAFVIETFSKFIKRYFSVINKQTIAKTCRMLVEMLYNDPAVRSGALNEKSMKTWLFKNLI